MIPLLLLLSSALAAPEVPQELRLSADLVYGFDGRSAFGPHLGLWRGWSLVPDTRLTLEAGAQLGYGYEPYSARAVMGEGVTWGGAHRLEALALMGPGLRLGAEGRGLLTVQAYAGWVGAFIRAGLDNDLVDVHGEDRVSASVLSSGAALTQVIGLSEGVGLRWGIRAPLPYQPAAVTSYVFAHVGVELSLGGGRE